MFSPSTSPGREAPSSYRSDAWRLEDAVADDDAIEKLEAAPVDEVHERAGKMGATALVPTRDGGASLASHPHVGPLLRRGFRYLGIQRQRVGYFGRFRSHCLVHPDGALWVTIRTERWLPLGRSRYFLVSIFDDGTCIETCAAPDPILKTSERHLVQRGSNDIETDLESHLRAVHARVRGGARPRILPARTHDDVVRQHTVMLRHVLSEEHAKGIVDVKANEMIVLRMAGTLALGLMFVVLLLARAVWGHG